MCKQDPLIKLFHVSQGSKGKSLIWLTIVRFDLYSLRYIVLFDSENTIFPVPAWKTRCLDREEQEASRTCMISFTLISIKPFHFSFGGRNISQSLDQLINPYALPLLVLLFMEMHAPKIDKVQYLRSRKKSGTIT